MLRIIVKPVFFGIGCGENQVVFRKWSVNGNHSGSADGMPQMSLKLAF